MEDEQRILECLQRIESIIASDEYEISDPYTIGGPTGNYVAPSPYHTECEWTIVSVCGVGSLSSPASYSIGSKNSNQPTLSTTGANSFGNLITSSPDNNNALPSFVGVISAAKPMMTYSGHNFMPLASPAFVYLTATVPNSSELLVTIQFRRKLDRVIPDKPRAKPHTHSHVGSRRGYRTMMEGFASQYQRDATPYEHEEIPVQQDTAMGGRFGQLKPTTISHRGINNGRRK